MASAIRPSYFEEDMTLHPDDEPKQPMSTMRAMSFVEHLEFEFGSNFLKDAITLGDVDNDTNNELVVGNVAGDVAIFKGTDCKPWKTGSAYGSVASVVIGDLFNENKNVLVSLSLEGWCNIFYVNKDGPCQEETHRHNPATNSAAECKVLVPFYTQRLMANTKNSMLADIDGDGSIELVIGMSDRVVRSYRWMKVSQFANSKSGGACLVAQNKWEFANQIGSIALNTNQDGTVSVLVSQPGGTYIQLNCYNNAGGDDASKLEYHSLSAAKMRNANVSTEIVGSIQRRNQVDTQQTLYALATLDGTLMLLEGDHIIWSLQVNHQLFTIKKLDITGDGNEEVVSCSLGGLTYIVNHENQSLRFQFREPVCTFTTGHYSVQPGENNPCLVYVTFSNKIYLYHNVRIPQLTTYNLNGMLESRPRITSLLSCLQLDPLTPVQLRQLFHWRLYGMIPKAIPTE